MSNPLVADDPRDPLTQAIDDMVADAERRRVNGFRVGLLGVIADGEETNVLAVIACTDGKLVSGPLLMPLYAAGDLARLLTTIAAETTTAQHPAPARPQ